jgi:hypothetical protein
MRRCQQVRQRAERMVERQRLLVEDIDGCAGNLFVFKRLMNFATVRVYDLLVILWAAARPCWRLLASFFLA